MPLIVCHPDNLAAVQVQLDRGHFDKPGFMSDTFRVRTNSHMDRDRPTGKYRLPDGSVVERGKIVVKTRLVEYGPEDVDWLLYAGVITEDRTMVVNVIDDAMFRMSYYTMPPVLDRRVIYLPTT